MVAAELAPHDAWQQPILRLADTAIGVAVGIAATWIGLRVIRRHLRSSDRKKMVTRAAGCIHKSTAPGP
jgi:uncharacterized membrane protein YccC